MTGAIGIAALVFYAMTIAIIFVEQKLRLQNPQRSMGTTRFYFLPWLVALLLHIALLILPMLQDDTLMLNLVNLGSIVMWLISAILFFNALKRRTCILALLVLPFSMLSILLVLLFSSDKGVIAPLNSGLGLHILFSLLAYSLLMLASFQALLLAYQNNQLHQRRTQGVSRILPALEDMEHLLFRFILTGVILLSLSLLSGFYFMDSLFGSQVAHKTILSIFAWIIFSVLLYGRWQYGWRGKVAIRWTLIGFALLMIAFFGSLFVREYLLRS